MSDDTYLLFLHGVGDGDPEDKWAAALNESLERAGYPALSTDRILVPKYAHALKGADDDVPLAPITIESPGRDEARQNRRAFERRTGALEFRLGRTDHGTQQVAVDAAIGVAVHTFPFAQAKNYLTDARIRSQVLARVLDKVPSTGRLMIVGHSLGSVIAADVVRRLPAAVEVTGLVTIGSPLAHASFEVDKLRATLDEPSTNLAWWVNFWNKSDPVVASRGLSSVFPWMLDYSIRTRSVGLQAHYAVDYLAHDSVAGAIGYGTFGSLSTELVRAERGVDVPVDAAEAITLLALRYAHHIKRHLTGDQQQRFAGALRVVQAGAVQELKAQRLKERRPLPAVVADLAFDLADPNAVEPDPVPIGFVGKDEAVVLLTVLAAQNVVRPFEITVHIDKRRAAMEDLAAEMGLGTKFGGDVFDALKRAQGELRGVQFGGWLRWGAIGAGAVALVIATGGLALAAGAGLAGAAAITSALAAFGPGGMIGGLLTAGTLVTAGGGGIAYGLANSGTSAEAVEAVVAGQLATAILRDRHGLEQDPAVWHALAETEAAVTREHERLDEFSDGKAEGLKELRRKIDVVGRALAYLRKNGLEPAVRVAG